MRDHSQELRLAREILDPKPLGFRFYAAEIVKMVVIAGSILIIVGVLSLFEGVF